MSAGGAASRFLFRQQCDLILQDANVGETGFHNGSVTVAATNITLDLASIGIEGPASASTESGGSVDILARGALSLKNFSSIEYSLSNGNSGEINITASQILMNESFISNEVSDFITIPGFSGLVFGEGPLLYSAGPVNISSTGPVVLADGSSIGTGGLGVAASGSVNILAGGLTLSSSSLETSSISSQLRAGDINVSTIGDIILSNNSEIETAAFLSPGAVSGSINLSANNISLALLNLVWVRRREG